MVSLLPHRFHREWLKRGGRQGWPSSPLQVPGKIPFSRWARPLCLALMAVILVACDQGPSAGPQATPAAPASGPSAVLPGDGSGAAAVPTPVPTSTGGPPKMATMSQAWGGQVESQIKHIPIGPPGSPFLIPQSVTPDGKFLLATYNWPRQADGPSTQPSKLVMVEIATGQSTDIPVPTISSPGVPYDVTADDQWVVWTQSPQEPGFFSEWTIYAYNRSTRSTKQVAQASRNSDGSPIAGSDGSARIEHGKVVWTESIPDRGTKRGNIVKMMDLESGQVTVLSSHGHQPRISWPYATWIELTAGPSGEPPTRVPNSPPQPHEAGIVVLNLQTGAKRTLAKPDDPREIAISGKSIVWLTAQGDRVILTDVDETFEQTIYSAQFGEQLEKPSLNERLVTWDTQATHRVWDRKQKQLVAFPSAHAHSNMVAANYLIWLAPQSESDENSPGNIDMLDTTRLP